MHERSPNYDVIVIGAGHAGCEAALAAARMGCKTLVLTVNINNIGLMPCNPAIGGPAKGQMVSEIDALGGEMGRAADQSFIQMKVLNRSRGPAVQCLRSQNDSAQYRQYMKSVLEATPNLDIRQAMVNDLMIADQTVCGVVTELGKIYTAKIVVIAAGTFLNGKTYTGLQSFSAGRISEFPSLHLSSALLRSGHQLGRLKTGTPPRVDARSIQYDQVTVQPGDDQFLRFSFRTPYNERFKHQVPCYLTYTNEQTHQIILNNLDRSPLYQKLIQGVGPRYCPSIEDKVVRFRDKDRHQIFIEPEGRETIEVYIQGLNTSLPEDVQEQMLKTMPGLETVKIIKAGYAVEYDSLFPNQLTASLESIHVRNLFFAGQMNGTSGYEEAAGQGLIAGINAGLRVQSKPAFILDRSEAYIGTLIDDLIHKEMVEPYRMMTSRSEYRLVLRQDNAIFRLSEKGHQLGLISESDIINIRRQYQQILSKIDTWKTQKISDEVKAQLGLDQKMTMYELAKRSEFSMDVLFGEPITAENFEDYMVLSEAAIMIKYEGYIAHQTAYIDGWERAQHKRIPTTLDYDAVSGLKTESREKFKKYRPDTIQSALKIAGINPADVSVLLNYISNRKTG